MGLRRCYKTRRIQAEIRKTSERERAGGRERGREEDRYFT